MKDDPVEYLDSVEERLASADGLWRVTEAEELLAFTREILRMKMVADWTHVNDGLPPYDEEVLALCATDVGIPPRPNQIRMVIARRISTSKKGESWSISQSLVVLMWSPKPDIPTRGFIKPTTKNFSVELLED